MDTSSLAATSSSAATRTDLTALAPPRSRGAAAGDSPLQEAFQNFVGQTFYGQLLSAMRKTVDKPAYFHGGRTEEVFQKQLDQVLAEKLTAASAETFAGPMYELFLLPRR